MTRTQTFQEFLRTQIVQIPVFSFVIDLLLAALLAFILSRIYIKYGNSLSNRRMFSKNFMLMTMTTMLIITIVKSSLALSLGLVGALSIVRFRSAIKEPEELSFLFLCISIGLGFGANQRIITITGFIIISAVIIIKNFKKDHDPGQNSHIILTSNCPGKVSLESIVETFKNNSSRVDLIRFDESGDVIEASFLVEFEDFKQLSNCKKEIQSLNDSIKFTFMEKFKMI